MHRNFRDLLDAQWGAGKFVCVGLDPVLSRIPDCVPGQTPGSRVYEFNRAIIDATVEVAGCFKPQSACYERLGREGAEALQATMDHLRAVAPEIPVILDAKRGDIGDTNEGYAEAIFDRGGFDAVTVSPYLGGEALRPLLRRTDKGIIVLVRTSNPGAGELQDRLVQPTAEELDLWGLEPNQLIPVYQLIAYRVACHWNYAGNCGVVVGATYPEELAHVRAIVGTMPILLPGIGAQGGDVTATVRAGADTWGRGMIVNNSRGISFAYEKMPQYGPAGFAEAATEAARTMHSQIMAALTLV